MDRLRAQDEVEVRLMSKKAPMEAIEASVGLSDEAYIGYIDGKPEAVFGLASMHPGVGSPWFVGTDAVVANAREWLGVAIVWLDRMNTIYPTLTNIVHRKNTKAVRWLRWMGFQFINEPVPGHPDFVQFVRYSPCALQQPHSC